MATFYVLNHSLCYLTDFRSQFSLPFTYSDLLQHLFNAIISQLALLWWMFCCSPGEPNTAGVLVTWCVIIRATQSNIWPGARAWLYMLYMDKLGVVLTGVIFQLTSGPKCTNKPVVETLTQPMQIQLQSQRGQLTHQLSALAFMHKVVPEKRLKQHIAVLCKAARSHLTECIVA